MRLRLTLLVAVGVAIAVGAAMLYTVRHRPAMHVTTAPVTVGRVQRDILTTGTLEPTTTVQVGSQISGTIAAVLVDFNSIVHKGDVLARLEPETYQADLSRAEGALLDAKAQLTNAQVTAADARTKLDRARTEFADGLITEADLETAQVASRDADAQVLGRQSQIVTATAKVDGAKVNLQHTVITSPIDGIVVSRQVDPGQTVAASLQTPVLFELAPELRHMQLQATIDEADVGSVRAGASVQFTVNSYPNTRFTATVAQVRLEPIEEATNKPLPLGTAAAGANSTAAASGAAPGANNQGPPAGGVVGYVAIANVNNPDERLRPGMTALVTLSGDARANVVRVPNVALAFQPPQDVLTTLGPEAQLARKTAAASGNRTAVVWELDSAGKPQPVSIRTGLSDSRFTEVAGGPLHANDRVITAMSRAG